MRPLSPPASRAVSRAEAASSKRSSISAFSARASSCSRTSATPARASASAGLGARIFLLHLPRVVALGFRWPVGGERRGGAREQRRLLRGLAGFGGRRQRVILPAA